MSDVVKLMVPVEPAYRALAVDLARKYTEIAGGTAADAQVAGDALTSAIEKAATGAAQDADVAVSLEHESGRVAMRVDCGAATATVSQPIPERKSS